VLWCRDDWLARVKAQVMTRDESTGGWVPLGRGGMSVVGLRRLTTTNDSDVTTEYRLHGQRIADQSVCDDIVQMYHIRANHKVKSETTNSWP